ncbi:hypothetical protein NMY22_g1726 [Coprinellus aureogranulatus]|nr:hypothetical protein NMY22_g1726 [Coprinellus aureogranulatus]
MAPPLAGKPPFATDEPDSYYGDDNGAQRRRAPPPKPDNPNKRTSAYDVVQSPLSTNRSQSRAPRRFNPLHYDGPSSSFSHTPPSHPPSTPTSPDAGRPRLARRSTSVQQSTSGSSVSMRTTAPIPASSGVSGPSTSAASGGPSNIVATPGTSNLVPIGGLSNAVTGPSHVFPAPGPTNIAATSVSSNLTPAAGPSSVMTVSQLLSLAIAAASSNLAPVPPNGFLVCPIAAHRAIFRLVDELWDRLDPNFDLVRCPNVNCTCHWIQWLRSRN